MAKDLNAINLNVLIEAVKADSVLQAALVVAVMLGVSLAMSGGSYTPSSPAPAVGSQPPPVSAPAPPGASVPQPSPPQGQAQSTPQVNQPLFGNKTPQQPPEIKPGQALDDVSKPDKVNDSFGRVKESQKGKSVEVRQ